MSIFQGDHFNHKTFKASFDWIFGLKLVASVRNGKQKLLITHETAANNVLIRYGKKYPAIIRKSIQLDSIDCIHTAITTLSTEDFDSNKQSELEAQDLFKETLNIRSSEGISREINLIDSEKFIAFKSWVAGIAESGIEAIRIQKEIEAYAHLSYPIANRLFKALVKVKPEFVYEYIQMIFDECVFEGKTHLTSLLANLYFVVKCIKNIKIKVKVYKFIFEQENVTSTNEQTIYDYLNNITFNTSTDRVILRDIYEFGEIIDESIKKLLNNS